MRHLLSVLYLIFLYSSSFGQTSKIKPDKYPSLLWEIKKPGSKPSYLFGTMHVSSKMVFHLSDSFYLGIKNAKIVALETNPGTWQEDFSRYDLDGEEGGGSNRRFRYGGYAEPQDYLSINSLKIPPFEKMMEAALYSNPSIINSFLYRSNSERSSDFEEDTYLDLHIFQTGKKLGKKICGVEDFDGSMQLVKEAYADAAKEKKKKERTYDYDEDFSYGKLEEAYRTGNLDLLDTINKRNSQSAAFDEKFLYKRNDIQAESIDSILKTGATLFVGVGAAHLPGERGVIEYLRRKGYTLRPITMTERDSHHKDAIEKIRVPVLFTKQTAADGFYSVQVPGKLYGFGRGYAGVDMQQFADMINGSYYMVTRLATNAAILGNSSAQVERKIDSVLYENIPGKILNKTRIAKDGYRGFAITNRTRRGDYQRYNIFVTPFEVLIFKMSGNGDYVMLGKEAEQFFSSIQLKAYNVQQSAIGWKKYSPPMGGFEVNMPHLPLLYTDNDWTYTAYDPYTNTAAEIIRTEVHNYGFVEQDTFDLTLMEESFASSSMVHKQLSHRYKIVGGYPALEVKYQYKDSSVALVQFLLDGPRYYTIIAHAAKENKTMSSFIQSFRVTPFEYGAAKKQTDSSLHFIVNSPVALDKKKKLSMYPADRYTDYDNDDDDSLLNSGSYIDKLVTSDSTGERIYVSYYKASPYYSQDSTVKFDSVAFRKQWMVRKQKKDTTSDGTTITEYEIGSKESSRMIKGKVWVKNGRGYKIETELDTLTQPSSFVQAFFSSFATNATTMAPDVKKKKADLFFTQFFSSDSIEHKRAIKNLSMVRFQPDNFALLKKSIASLSWKDKRYLDIKKELLGKLSSLPGQPISDYLREVYFASGDTLELQYTALETLLQQGTKYAYQVFSSIVQTDPPVLNVQDGITRTYKPNRYKSYDISEYEEKSKYQNGQFLDELTDSLALTAGIYKGLLPLININDYEEEIMELTGTLVDSAMIAPEDYESYLSKFILEAKQTLKKQLISERAKAIEKAKADATEKKGYNTYGGTGDDEDNGNNKLSLYATLLLPYWDKNSQVQSIFKQLLASNDIPLKYNTVMLLLRNKKPVADSFLLSFAAQDEYRYTLYTDLQKYNALDRFPLQYKSQKLIAQSELLHKTSYQKADTIELLEKVIVKQGKVEGYVYVFKYKEKKEDMTWKLGSVGILPKDEKKYVFDHGLTRKEKQSINYTTSNTIKLDSDLSEKEQIQKMIRKLKYSKRKSAAQFYDKEARYPGFDIKSLRD